ncbi:MAG: hypothetical protein FPO08_13665 [Geobacter sp.]|uniref:hypothetical protein n=1 Tax=Geomonas ferrireducens TaxID=2570227 RepID=UPI0010A8A405|nr:hypothetical protein [Geomonas ferrireducens]TSK05873.1 MAG: hypothetical protein FPO08_13665 [Geobacter sp.]
MKEEKRADPAERWVATFTWEDRLIARFFPRFFKKYAPEEVQQQWAAILARKQQRRSGQDGDPDT